MVSRNGNPGLGLDLRNVSSYNIMVYVKDVDKE